MMARMSSAKSNAPAEASENTREAILSAALRVLAEEGHQALTVRRIATEAGCSTIGVYTWFGGKDGLVDAIFVEGFTSFAAALRSARTRRGPMGKARALAYAYRTWALSHPMHYQVMFHRVVDSHKASDQAIIAGTDSYAALQEAIAEAAGRGELHATDLEAVAMMVWATVHGLVSLQLIAGQRPNDIDSSRTIDDRAYELAVDTLVRGLCKEVNDRRR